MVVYRKFCLILWLSWYFIYTLAIHGDDVQHVCQWNYGNEGPITWGNCFKECNGTRQSPVNIAPSNVIYNKDFGKLKMSNLNQSIVTNQYLINNGHSVQVNIVPCNITVTLQSPLNGEIYNMLQAHFHWSQTNKGSETFLNNVQYSLEEHLVFTNSKYDSMTESLKHTDGLAVISILYKIGNHNPNLDPVINNLRYVRYKGQKHHIDGLDIQSIVGDKRDRYFVMEGSLTTPPCTENVMWHIMADNPTISTAQLQEFQKTYVTNSSASPVLLEKNFRPIQNLNGRTIQSSFQMEAPKTQASTTQAVTVTGNASKFSPHRMFIAFIMTLVIVFNYC